MGKSLCHTSVASPFITAAREQSIIQYQRNIVWKLKCKKCGMELRILMCFEGYNTKAMQSDDWGVGGGEACIY